MEWPGITTLGDVVSFRKEGDEPRTTPSVRYYISSVKLSAEELAHAAREHWSIEVKLHCKLDVALKGRCLQNSPRRCRKEFLEDMTHRFKLTE